MSGTPIPNTLDGVSAPIWSFPLGGEVVEIIVAVGVTGVGVIVDVILGEAGMWVIVAGGVTRRSTCCPGWMIDSDVSPFQAIRSSKLTPYKFAIQARYSPLLTV